MLKRKKKVQQTCKNNKILTLKVELGTKNSAPSCKRAGFLTNANFDNRVSDSSLVSRPLSTTMATKIPISASSKKITGQPNK